MTVLEATATGLPVLSYKLNYGELIDKYMSGFYSNCNFMLLNNNLYKLLNNTKYLKRSSEYARNYAHTIHNIAYNISIFISYLKDKT